MGLVSHSGSVQSSFRGARAPRLAWGRSLLYRGALRLEPLRTRLYAASL